MKNLMLLGYVLCIHSFITLKIGSIIPLLIVIIALVIHWKGSIMIHSFWYHRYGAHKMFSFNKKIWLHVFTIGVFLILGASFLSTRTYAFMHRMHHAYADTENDPHLPNPGQTSWSWLNHVIGFLRMMVYTVRPYHGSFVHLNKRDGTLNANEQGAYITTNTGTKLVVEEEFYRNLPEQFRYEKYLHHPVIRILWVLLYLYGYIYIFDIPLIITIPAVFLQQTMAPLHGAMVNYVAHMFGDHVHENSPARNVNLQLSKEGQHNNHHFDSNNPDFTLGTKPQKDPVYWWMVRPLHISGIISIDGKYVVW